MRAWLAAQYETMCHVNLEADDVMGILMTNGSYAGSDHGHC
jgi:hypothetical protein